MLLKYRDNDGTHTVENVELVRMIEPETGAAKNKYRLGILSVDEKGKRTAKLVHPISNDSWEVCSDSAAFGSTREELLKAARDEDLQNYEKIKRLQEKSKETRDILTLLEKAV